MTMVIRAEGLAKAFGTTRALDGVDLEVASGGLLLGGRILGPVLGILTWTTALTVVFALLTIRQDRRLS